MYEVVTGMLEKMHWMFLNQVALGTEGASSMTWHRTWLVARTRADVPTLINVHCSAHCGTLVAEDATRAFLQFQMLNCFANKAYEWVGHSTNRCNKLKPLLKGVFKEDYVVVLQIHVVRWFSQGNVIDPLTTVNAGVTNEEQHGYESMFSFTFFIEFACRSFTRVE